MGYFILRICAVAGFNDAVGDTGTPGFDHDRDSAVWRISPVGIIGLLAVGGLTLLLQGFIA